MNAPLFYYDPIFLEHESVDHHPENPGRLIAVMEYLDKHQGLDGFDVRSPQAASNLDVGRVHTADHVNRLHRAKPGHLDMDTYIAERSLDAAYTASGALIGAIDAIVDEEADRAFCAVRPPGHHAERDRAMGFCLFNNVAIGARYAQTRGFERVFIIDFDVHHGNGTQHIFETDPTVFYLSSHEYPYYPGTGAANEIGIGDGRGYTRNFPLAMGAGNAEFLQVYRDYVPGVLEEFDPDLLLISAGYDIHDLDPLAYLTVTTEGIRGAVRSMLEAAEDIPVVFTLEGGYNYRALSEGVSATLEEIATV